ncbi:peptide methionine sulfoxide reductase MsrA [Hydrogenimonas sp.]|nr:peptide methionine sulfoxide reductase MsrA [Hydrogenimonas sp.]
MIKKLVITLFTAGLFAGNGVEMSETTERAVLGGGCFWCLEAVYEEVKGVEEVVSGYAGGTVENPTYEAVCSGSTGHAEVVEIMFRPDVVSFEELLDIFWSIHDPTTLNRQGADVGTQYRSVIFYRNEKQKEIAKKSKAEAQKRFSSPIVTEISPLEKFWPAEEYHQDYFRKNPYHGYCRAVVAPKVEKFKKEYSGWLK